MEFISNGAVVNKFHAMVSNYIFCNSIIMVLVYQVHVPVYHINSAIILKIIVVLLLFNLHGKHLITLFLGRHRPPKW